MNAYLGDYPYLSAELTDAAGTKQALDSLPKLAGIVHAAAMTAVDKCETERDLAWQVNVETTRRLAHYAQQRGIGFIYISTDYVFDGETGAPYRESQGVNPTSVYATTKLAGEHAALTYHSKACIVRAALPYGDLPHVKKDFVRWLRTELEAKRRVRIVADQTSSPTYIGDLAQAVTQLIALGQAGVFHAAGKLGLSRLDYAKLIAKTFSLDASLIDEVTTAELKQPAKRPRDARLDCSKLAALHIHLRGVDETLSLLKPYRS